MRNFGLCVFGVLLYICATSWGQDPLPIMQLYEFDPDPNNIIKTSGCKDGLVNDIDFFTLRGKVNKNGSNPDAFGDTNLFLRAVQNPEINSWTPQCRIDLAVCGTDLDVDCYCERKDADGYYHLVMTIMAKSIYLNGALQLSWNDKRSPFNPSVTSNVVSYYTGIISNQKKGVLYIGTTEMVLEIDPSCKTNNDFPFDKLTSAKIKNATFCVYNLRPNSLIEIKENDNAPVQTTTDSCATLQLTDDTVGAGRVLTMSFTESGGCQRTGSYMLRLSQAEPTEEGISVTTKVFIALFVIFLALGFIVSIVLAIFFYRERKERETNKERELEERVKRICDVGEREESERKESKKSKKRDQEELMRRDQERLTGRYGMAIYESKESSQLELEKRSLILSSERELVDRYNEECEKRGIEKREKEEREKKEREERKRQEREERKRQERKHQRRDDSLSLGSINITGDNSSTLVIYQGRDAPQINVFGSNSRNIMPWKHAAELIPRLLDSQSSTRAIQNNKTNRIYPS